METFPMISFLCSNKKCEMHQN